LDEPQHRILAALDIQGFGRSDRTNLDRLHLHRELHALYPSLLKRSRIAASQVVASDTGDGVILSIDGSVSKLRLLTRFVGELARRLAAANQGRRPAEQMRLRMALHAGDVLADPEPIHGEAVILTARLLDADVLRACLLATDEPLAVVVSSTIYEEVVKHGYGGVVPGEYLPTVAECKETRVDAWLHVPGDTDAPRRAGVIVIASLAS